VHVPFVCICADVQEVQRLCNVQAQVQVQRCRCRSAEVQMWKGVQVCRWCRVQRCRRYRSALVQRCRGAGEVLECMFIVVHTDVQRYHMVQMCRRRCRCGADVQRCSRDE